MPLASSSLRDGGDADPLLLCHPITLRGALRHHLAVHAVGDIHSFVDAEVGVEVVLRADLPLDVLTRDRGL